MKIQNETLALEQYIEQKLVEWQGKTITDNKHFQLELKNTLMEVATFVARDFLKIIKDEK